MAKQKVSTANRSFDRIKFLQIELFIDSFLRSVNVQ